MFPRAHPGIGVKIKRKLLTCINNTKRLTLNYNKIYTDLIEKSRHRTIIGYGEQHHIIPRCLNGSDDKTNLASLTPEEHYVAHQLLVKLYPDNHKLAKAAAMMIPNRPSNKLYGWLRRRFATAQSIEQSGASNSQYDTIWIYNINLEVSKKINSTEHIPEGWHQGRIINFSKIKELAETYNVSTDYVKLLYDNNTRCFARVQRSLAHQKAKQDKVEIAYKWYNEFILTNLSLREFVKQSTYDKSHVAFIKMLKRYVPEFTPEHGKKYSP